MSDDSPGSRQPHRDAGAAERSTASPYAADSVDLELVDELRYAYPWIVVLGLAGLAASTILGFIGTIIALLIARVSLPHAEIIMAICATGTIVNGYHSYLVMRYATAIRPRSRQLPPQFGAGAL